MTFEVFFKKATGSAPYPYQTRIATEGQHLPSLVSVPTGLGKTAASILGWLWRRRFADDETQRATPRRLVYCLPMRVLVEQTRDCAVQWMDKLGLLANDAPKTHPAGQVGVHVLMGGDLEIDWDHWPDRDQILIGTQDMLLSRALNRGYAMSRFRWPVQFGLLNNDCQWIMDEVQLMGNGLATTAQLQAFRRKLGTVNAVLSTWMSATMREDWLRTVDFDHTDDAPGKQEIDERDRSHPILKPRFEAIKRLNKADFVVSDDGKPEARLARDIHKPGTRTLVIVNTVKRSMAVHSALEKLKPDANLILLHSRFRPADRKIQIERLIAEPAGAGTIAVCTQVVEAGVDVSARMLITDLAPWSSLVQRFGRCNRNGEFNETQNAEVVWIEPEDLQDEKKLNPAPYTAAELRDSAARVSVLLEAGSKALPSVESAMAYTHVPRRKDLVDLFDTTPDLAGADIDISRFIRETDDHDVQVFWRDIPENEEPGSDEKGPARAELCSVPIGELRKWLEKPGRAAWRWDHLDRLWQRVKPNALYPGLVLMLRSSDGGYSPDKGWNGTVAPTMPLMAIAARYNESEEEDKTVENREWATVAEHTDQVVSAASALFEESGEVLAPWKQDFLDAARWHDAGKAHLVFQAAMPEGAPRACVLWAKSLPKMKRYGRRGVRHELASALSMLANGKSNLAAYLAAAHHGKVRLSIRSLPHEKPPPDDIERRFARGIWDGETLPTVAVGGGVNVPETILKLTYMELGEDDTTGPSWLARMLALRDSPELGPFRLAFLEAILRIADWRASGGPVTNTGEEVGQ